MAYASLIYLHDSVSQNDATAYSSCVNAARLIAAVVGYLQEGEALLMTPFVTVNLKNSLFGSFWHVTHPQTGLTVACKVLSREVAASQSLGQSSQTHIPATPTQTETELSNIMQIMNQLRPVYPVVSKLSHMFGAVSETPWRHQVLNLGACRMQCIPWVLPFDYWSGGFLKPYIYWSPYCA